MSRSRKNGISAGFRSLRPRSSSDPAPRPVRFVPQQQRVAGGDRDAGPLLPLLECGSAGCASRECRAGCRASTMPPCAVVMASFEQSPPSSVTTSAKFEPVVQLAVVRDVAQRVDVREVQAVVGNLLPLEQEVALDEGSGWSSAPERADGPRRLARLAPRSDGRATRSRRSARARPACAAFSAVIRFSTPRSSSSPQRPPVRQLVHPRLELVLGDLAQVGLLRAGLRTAAARARPTAPTTQSPPRPPASAS